MALGHYRARKQTKSLTIHIQREKIANSIGIHIRYNQDLWESSRFHRRWHLVSLLIHQVVKENYFSDFKSRPLKGHQQSFYFIYIHISQFDTE